MGCGIFNSLEKVLLNMGNCVEALVENRKKDAFKNLVGVGRSITELTLKTTSCAIEHTPQAVSAVKKIKKEITDSIEEEVRNYKKEQKEKELNEFIKQLKNK
jgi:phosphopantothenate synthetase